MNFQEIFMPPAGLAGLAAEGLVMHLLPNL